MAAGRADIGNRLDDLAARNTLQMDAPFAQDVGRVAQEYVGLVPPSQRSPAIGRYIDDIINIAQTGGTIAGPAYSSMRSQLGKMAETVRMSDPAASNAFRGLRNALDENMTR